MAGLAAPLIDTIEPDDAGPSIPSQPVPQSAANTRPATVLAPGNMATTSADAESGSPFSLYTKLDVSQEIKELLAYFDKCVNRVTVVHLLFTLT